MSAEGETAFNRKNQVRFLNHMLNVLPAPYSSQESNRLTLIYFVVGGLEILGELEKVNKTKIVDYVYSLQVVPDKDQPGIFLNPSLP